ncbi:PREDICTED: uncharacterized protein LOC108769865 [Trachymyrmex cornetzi]|uniref:BESS domain-containing protein n=1 Tax=Trachymyrmex cornetzi TaxID=471704 RepID=A0A151IRG6_9HYME|nr:PREDICTED: uncharacterized protein LOC108769865 [Trachymyrmex cornetzi]KYN09318.1 hypothetical protein ALC57_18588 [Trachymyrmex cornetzi]
MLVDECHTRWTRLRERYSREKKQKQEETTTGSGVSKRKTFEFFDNMHFLDPFVKKRRTMTNVQRRNVSPSARYCNLKKNFGAKNEKNNLLQNSSNVQISTPPSTGYSLEQNFGASGEKENLSPANVTTSIRQVSIDCNPNSRQNIFKEARFDSDSNEVVPRTFSPSLSSSLSKTPSPSPVVSIEKQTDSSNIRSSDFERKNASDFEKQNLSTLRIKPKGKSEQDLLQNTICKVTSLLENKYSTTSSTLSINSEVQEDLTFCQLILSLLKNLPQSEKTEKKKQILRIIYDL